MASAKNCLSQNGLSRTRFSQNGYVQVSVCRCTIRSAGKTKRLEPKWLRKDEHRRYVRSLARRTRRSSVVAGAPLISATCGPKLDGWMEIDADCKQVQTLATSHFLGYSPNCIRASPYLQSRPPPQFSGNLGRHGGRHRARPSQT